MASRDISLPRPGKRDEELLEAVAAGVLLNVESPDEASASATISARLVWPARVALVVNPNFEMKPSLGVMMSREPEQFGIDAEAVPALLHEIGTLGLPFEGFNLFCGSQDLKAAAIVAEALV